MGKLTFKPGYDEPEITWEKNDPTSVESARRFFDSHIYGEARFFKVGSKGDVTEVRKFDPDYETLFVLYFGGGC
jgi:hypothetical protein